MKIFRIIALRKGQVDFQAASLTNFCFVKKFIEKLEKVNVILVNYINNIYSMCLNFHNWVTTLKSRLYNMQNQLVKILRKTDDNTFSDCMKYKG